MMAFTPAIKNRDAETGNAQRREDADPQPPALVSLRRLCVLTQHDAIMPASTSANRPLARSLVAEVRASSGIGSG